ELERQQGIAVLGHQIVQRRGVTRGRGHLVAPVQGGDRPLPAEAARCSGDEPNLVLVAAHACTLPRWSPVFKSAGVVLIPGLHRFTGSVGQVSRATLEKNPRDVA